MCCSQVQGTSLVSATMDDKVTFTALQGDTSRSAWRAVRCEPHTHALCSASTVAVEGQPNGLAVLGDLAVAATIKEVCVHWRLWSHSLTRASINRLCLFAAAPRCSRFPLATLPRSETLAHVITASYHMHARCRLPASVPMAARLLWPARQARCMSTLCQAIRSPRSL